MSVWGTPAPTASFRHLTAFVREWANPSAARACSCRQSCTAVLASWRANSCFPVRVILGLLSVKASMTGPLARVKSRMTEHMYDDRPTYLSLFSGIGGLNLAVEALGFRCVGQVEWDESCRRVLERWWPDVPRWLDIREFAGADFVRCLRGGPDRWRGQHHGVEEPAMVLSEVAREDVRQSTRGARPLGGGIWGRSSRSSDPGRATRRPDRLATNGRAGGAGAGARP